MKRRNVLGGGLLAAVALVAWRHARPWAGFDAAAITTAAMLGDWQVPA
jgi:hypothetical protein